MPDDNSLGGSPGTGDYAEAVLCVVDLIPPGRVMTYGMIAELVRDVLGKGSARTVGAVMAGHGAAVNWHRVVAAGGRLPPGLEQEAAHRLRADGTPMRGGKADVRVALWWPGEQQLDAALAAFATDHRR